MRKDKYENRKYIIYGFFISVGILILIRLFYLQIYSNEYVFAAENNTRRDISIYPPRGLIYDRNQKLIVYNEAVFDLMIIPNQAKNINISALCKLLQIDSLDYISRYEKAKKYSRRKASIFEKQLSKVQTAYLQEKLFMFPGFYVQSRTLRTYPYKSAAHLLGYISEATPNEILKDTFYTQGDYIGKSGLEKYYDVALRGRKGVKKLMVDVYNREKGPFREGKYDIPAVNGSDLYTGLDMDLQAYGELLMQNKIGAIIAIEPKTGEILAMISSPNYDPNMLSGSRARSANFEVLLNDPQKPLLNRALISSYPPGSTFKLTQALIGQQEGILFPSTQYSCHNGFNYKGLHVGCHSHKSPLDLEESIEISCNAYYCNSYIAILNNTKYSSIEEAYNKWADYEHNMGFGKTLGIDLPYEKGGNIPTSKYYDKYYGRHHWNAITTISLAIGQGEILTTPLQLANQAAWIANRGFYYTPHIVARVGNSPASEEFLKKHFVGIDSSYFKTVVDGMEKVVLQGTARLAQIDGISVCGKTGTAQNPHGENHSVFIAFAPKENPKIAIAVFIENSGYGGSWAAPIASLMIEKYLNRSIDIKRKPLEIRMINGNLIATTK